MCVSITCANKTLRGCSVAIAAIWGDEGGEVAVGWVNRDAVIARLSQSQGTWEHCGQEICIESQEISVNIHVFDLVASQMSDIK